jgi:GNAT superfamily N-acetyltransferase
MDSAKYEMNECELKARLLSGLSSKKFPGKTDVEIEPLEKIYTPERIPTSIYFIYLKINCPEKKPLLSLFTPLNGLTFFYNDFEKTIDVFGIELGENLRKKGYGRMLVETMENFGRDLGCRSVDVKFSMNDSFWKHIGYANKGKTIFLEKRLE